VGHVDYFQSLTIVNSAVINIGIQVAILYPGAHCFSIFPEMVLMDHMVLFLVF
jgi:hypothetical protein